MTDPVDILIEVPYLWMYDGYGQTAPLVIDQLATFCESHNLTWKVIRTNIINKTVDHTNLTQKIAKNFVNKRDAPSSKILLRYHYPSADKHTSDKLVTYTMFETDACPQGWVEMLDKADLVLVPNPKLKEIFEKATTTKVETVYLPLHPDYYAVHDADLITGKLNPEYTFSFIGTASVSTDRKGILELSAKFEEMLSTEDVSLVIKSRGFGQKTSKIVSQPAHKDIKGLVEFYCRSHCGVYPSRGEGYGLPQIESSLLGRPVILADNSAMSWASTYMPWVIKLPCVSQPAIYSGRVQGDPGNWGYVDMNDFVLEMKNIFELWTEDSDKYKDKMLYSHLSNPLRYELSYSHIQRQLEQHLLPLF
jgi:hypothetical protein